LATRQYAAVDAIATSQRSARRRNGARPARPSRGGPAGRPV